MTAVDPASLYALLPEFIRLRDETAGGGTLRALVEVIATQAQVVSEGLDQLYDDQFVETCAPWVLPYIGDLVGFTPLQPLGSGQPSASRGEVASTIGDRRRKGTLAMLEQLCDDVTRDTVVDDQGVGHALPGWIAVAVEYFSRIATTQYVRNHLRAANTIVDVHSPMTAIDIGGAFDLAPRTVDVRRIASRRGRYNLPAIGLFVWRLAAYQSIGHPVREVGPHCYTADPFGRDVPMINRPSPAAGTFALTQRVNVPFFLQRYPLFVAASGYSSVPPGPPPVVVVVDGVAVAPETIGWCDLTGWNPPTGSGIEVAVDPVLGRLVFATAPVAGATILLDHGYAFSGDYGGGNYDQPVSASAATLERQLGAPEITTLAAAPLEAATHQILQVSDGGIRSGDVTMSPGPGLLVVRAGPLQRPVLAGNLFIHTVPDASVTLRGIGVDGSITVYGTGPFTLRLEHCTITGALDWSDADTTGYLTIDHTLAGPLTTGLGVVVEVEDSAVDARADDAAALAGPAGAAAGAVTLVRSTVIGTLHARTIPLLDTSIVTGMTTATEQQAGCLRYSYTGAGSVTPRRFRCQPDLAAEAAVNTARTSDPSLGVAAVNLAEAAADIPPVFTSRTAGQPGYLQLADACPAELRQGGDHGTEMGVFAALYSSRREINLTYRINEYLRIGLEAAIFHAT